VGGGTWRGSEVRVMEPLWLEAGMQRSGSLRLHVEGRWRGPEESLETIGGWDTAWVQGGGDSEEGGSNWGGMTSTEAANWYHLHNRSTRGYGRS
jgi:hypothetical protein